MANAIATEIRLAGADEIKRVLAELGVVGEKAFGQVREAVDLANTRLQRVSQAVEAVGASARRVADAGRDFGQAFNGLNDSLGRLRSSAADTGRRFALLSGTIIAAGAGLAAFVKSGLNAADDLIKQSQAVGLSIEAYQKLGFAASQAGVEQQQFATAVARFSQEVTRQAAEQRKALADFATSTVASMQKAGIVTVGFATTASTNFKLIGDTARQVQAQLRSRGIDIPISVITAKLQEMAASTGEARKQFEQLAGQSLSGAQSALQKLGLEGDTSAKALQKLGVNVLDAKGNVRELPDLLGEVADKFAAMPQGIERTSLATELFGRRAGPLMVPLLIQGSKAIQALGEEYAATGLLIRTEQGQLAEAANDAVSALGFTLRNAQTQFAVLFGPSLKKAADALNASFVRNIRTLQDFGRTIANQVEPVLLDLVKLLEGRDNEIQNTWIIVARDAVVSFGRAAQGAVTNIIIPAFNALLSAMTLVANTFNRVFGTELTGGQLLAALAITKLLGLFGLLGAAISVVGNTINVLVRGLVLLVANFALIGSAARALAVTLATLIPAPVLIGVAALAAGFLLLRNNGELAKATLRTFGVDAAAADQAVDGFLQSVNRLGADFQRFIATASNRGVLQAIKQDLSSLRISFDIGALTATLNQVREIIRSVFVTLPTEAGLALRAGFAQLPEIIRGLFANLFTDITNNWRNSITGFVSFVQGALQGLLNLIARLRGELFSAATSANQFRDSGGGFASGGYTGSIGRTRIAGVVHGGEYVQPARIVARPGVLDFMETLRRTGDLRSAIDRFTRGFSLGGLVDHVNASLALAGPSALPRFQTGGLVPAMAGGRHLGSIDLRVGTGPGQVVRVFGDDATAQSLSRYATLERLRSAGRKPSSEG